MSLGSKLIAHGRPDKSKAKQSQVNQTEKRAKGRKLSNEVTVEPQHLVSKSRRESQVTTQLEKTTTSVDKSFCPLR